MLNRINLQGTTPSTSELRRALPRGGTDVSAMVPTVEPIIEDIKERGAEAALEYGERFDHIRPQQIRVPDEVLVESLNSLAPEVRTALENAIARVEAVHKDQLPHNHETTLAPGAVVKEVFLPVEQVGLYVPGGNAVYPSSVIMNVVPALVAGVSRMVVTSPPQADNNGWPHPTILATCQLLGVHEVWAAGGAQAIALLAYGDPDAGLEPVDLITGPGNIFVTAAKRVVNGVVGIDSEAGPTEIAIIADDSADPVAVAYDLISQAEHDVMAASVLITDSEQLADAVDEEIIRRYEVTENCDRVKEALSGQQSGIVLVDNHEDMIAAANAYAAEHLEIHTRTAVEDADRIINAGAIFVGPYAPVPLGDYAAGSNHVLPTSGSARFSSGLNTRTFMKAVHQVHYDKEGLAAIAPSVIALANEERLPAHGEAVRARFEQLPIQEGK